MLCPQSHCVGRSLAACELLYNAGYKNLFWVQGGLEAADEEVCLSNLNFMELLEYLFYTFKVQLWKRSACLLCFFINISFFQIPFLNVEQDLIVEGPIPLKFAGIGGVSEFLGWFSHLNLHKFRKLLKILFYYIVSWKMHFHFFIIFSWTDQQRAAAAKEGWAYRLVFSARLVTFSLSLSLSSGEHWLKNS